MTSFGGNHSAPQAPSRSRYAGVTCADTREPMLQPGTYRVRIDSCEIGHNPKKGTESYKIKCTVRMAADGSLSTVGSVAVAIFTCTSAGICETKRAIMHAAGFGCALGEPVTREKLAAAEARFDALDESKGGQGSIIEASAGRANGAPSIAGRLVDVVVGRGGDVIDKATGRPTGDFYRTYTWGVVPEAEQK